MAKITISSPHSEFSHCSIYVRWILGHEGIQSNEVVDDTAKKAITEGSSHNIVLPALLHKIKTSSSQQICLQAALLCRTECLELSSFC
jgi:hypothetical protein